jgi:hypothetical protein
MWTISKFLIPAPLGQAVVAGNYSELPARRDMKSAALIRDALRCLGAERIELGRVSEDGKRVTLWCWRRVFDDNSGAVAVEFAMVLCGLFLPVFYGAQQIGPPLLAWAQNLSAQITLAQHLCASLAGACT